MAPNDRPVDPWGRGDAHGRARDRTRGRDAGLSILPLAVTMIGVALLSAKLVFQRHDRERRLLAEYQAAAGG